jgi:hypothetical protein
MAIEMVNAYSEDQGKIEFKILCFIFSINQRNFGNFILWHINKVNQIVFLSAASKISDFRFGNITVTKIEQISLVGK